jgi:uncharacterized protein (DUF2267 family)
MTRPPSPEYTRFVELVSQAIGGSVEEAERATQAVLETLADRIAKGEASDLAGQLPPELAPWLATDTPAQRFGVEDFVRRVADREGVDAATARRHARAVLGILADFVSDEELADTIAELPREYEALLPVGWPGG